MAITSFGYDTTVGQQPGPGGWWPGTGGSRGGASTGGQIDYSATGPGAAGSIGQISDLINQINRGAQTQANQARIPMAPTLEAESSRNIQSELQGNLPPDVLALIGQQAAEAGVASGSTGSPAGYLKALGLTSLGQTEAGQRDLSAAYARNPGAPIYDTSRQLITPLESAQLGLEASRLGGGGGGYGSPSTRGGSPGYGAYSAPGDLGYSSTAVDSGYTPNAAWATDPQAAWLNSIGYGAGPMGQPGTGSAVYVDPTTHQMIDYSTGSPVGVQGGPVLPGMSTNLTPPPFSSDIDWSNLFAGSPGT